MGNLIIYNIFKPGYGSQSNAYNESNAVRIDNAGDHSSLRMSKHIAPV